MEEVKEAEANEEGGVREETPLEIASKDVMTALRESRENIQSVLPHVLERLEVGRLQETLKHEIEEAIYIAIRKSLQKTLEDILLKVLDEKIEKAVESAFTEVITRHLTEDSVKEYIKNEIMRKLNSIVDDQAWKINRQWEKERFLENLKDRIKEQVLKGIDDEVVKNLKKRVLKQVEEEKPILAEALAELGRRIDSLEAQIHLLQSQIYDLRGR